MPCQEKPVTMREPVSPSTLLSPSACVISRDSGAATPRFTRIATTIFGGFVTRRLRSSISSGYYNPVEKSGLGWPLSVWMREAVAYQADPRHRDHRSGDVRQFLIYG